MIGSVNMNFDYIFNNENEKPLERIVSDGGFCGIMRTIACVGDSLSSGEFESLDENGNKGYHDYFDYSWGQFMARMAGCKVYNFSRGGMTASEYLDSFAEANGFWDMDKAAQGYIIALGVNDVLNNHETVIGTAEDRENLNTFSGRYAEIIRRYKAIQPEAKFFLVTMPRSSRDSGINMERANAVSSLLYELAECFENTYVIDLRKYAPEYDDEFKRRFYLGGHLNAAGYLFTAQMMVSYIDYIIRHDFEAFRQIGFVGTPYRFTE